MVGVAVLLPLPIPNLISITFLSILRKMQGEVSILPRKNNRREESIRTAVDRIAEG
jgi:hypothetical protein